MKAALTFLIGCLEFMSAASLRTFAEGRQDTEFWGRLVESAVGASLLNALQASQAELFYWGGRNREVDYVFARGKAAVPIEVKSGRKKTVLPGIEAFAREFRIKRSLLVGAGGIPLEEFLSTSPAEWLR